MRLPISAVEMLPNKPLSGCKQKGRRIRPIFVFAWRIFSAEIGELLAK
jgi:hypothetical protein